MNTPTFLTLLVCSMVPKWASAQGFNLPQLSELRYSVDTYYSTLDSIQIEEIRQTKKFRWLSYLPSPGYSPFTGGFTMSLNLTGPLQEVRANHATRLKANSIIRNHELERIDLHNSVAADYQHIQNLISEFRNKSVLDSLGQLTYDLVSKKYQNNEITPTEFIAATKLKEEYNLNRQQEWNTIQEAINALFYKAKMGVPASNAQYNHLTDK